MQERGRRWLYLRPTDAIERNHRLEATLECRSSFGRYGRSPQIGVSITPGTTALTLISRGESSPASERHIARPLCWLRRRKIRQHRWLQPSTRSG
jgi:hypothetical protein